MNGLASARRGVARAPWAAFIGVSLAVASHGCGSESTDTARAGAGGDAAAGFLAAPQCTDCLSAQCSVELRACITDPACDALRKCRAACSTPECDQDCSSKHDPDGGAPASFAALDLCAQGRCTQECKPPPASPARVTECRSLFDEKIPSLSTVCGAQRDCACAGCTDEWLTCLGDADCAQGLECALRVCANGQCTATCPSAGLREPFFRAQACSEIRCGSCRAGVDAG